MGRLNRYTDIISAGFVNMVLIRFQVVPQCLNKLKFKLESCQKFLILFKTYLFFFLPVLYGI